MKEIHPECRRRQTTSPTSLILSESEYVAAVASEEFVCREFLVFGEQVGVHCGVAGERYCRGVVRCKLLQQIDLRVPGVGASGE